MQHVFEIVSCFSYASVFPFVKVTRRKLPGCVYLTAEQLEKILKGCKKNERLAQKEFYHHYYEYAMSIALRYSSNYDNTVEMINDAFLKVFKSIQTFEPRYGNTVASFTAWVKQIIICSCIDHIRKYNKKETMARVSLEQVAIADGQTADEMLRHKEIFKCIQQLSPGYKIVFNLFVIEGFSHVEIAARLNISEGTSKSNLYKARQNLRLLLEESNNIDYATVV